MALGESQSGRSMASVIDVPPVRRAAGTTTISGRSDRTASDGSRGTVTHLPTRHRGAGDLPSDPTEPAVLRPVGSASSVGNRASERLLLGQVRDQLRAHQPLDVALTAIGRTLIGSHRVQRAAVFEWSGRAAVPRTMVSADDAAISLTWADHGLMAICREEGRRLAVPTVVPLSERGRRPPSTLTVYTPIGAGTTWGVLVVETASEPASRDEHELLDAAAAAIETAVMTEQLERRADGQRRRGDALSRMTEQLNSQLELPSLMRTLLDETVGLFDADHAGIWRLADGRLTLAESYGPSNELLEQFGVIDEPLRDETDIGQGPIVFRDPPSDLPSQELREAAARVGIETLATAPLVVEADLAGVIMIAHERAYDWTREDLDLLSSLSRQAGIALRNARNFGLMATWAAQLQSIQQLGTRLNRWGTVNEIGNAIALELRELIDYHNVRVYRVIDDVVEPVAWRGEIGEYTDEDRDQLRLKVGAGITGWVAQHGVAQYLSDAAHDPRAQTIPGTEEDLPESMLVAPMLYEDRVLGVIVLSKLGINQFTGRRPALPRDLRLDRRSGDGQRRCHREAPGPVESPGTPALQPARADARHRVDPLDTRTADRPGADRRPSHRDHAHRQHRHRRARRRGTRRPDAVRARHRCRHAPQPDARRVHGHGGAGCCSTDRRC